MKRLAFTPVQAAFVAYVAGLFSCFIIMQCGTSIKTAESIESGSTGEYYYIDLNGTLHAKRTCTKIATSKGLHMANRYLKDEELNYRFICPKCVSDSEYNKIKSPNNKNTRL